MPETLGLLAFGPDGWGDELASGAWLTLRLALTALPLGLTLGLGIALMRAAAAAPLRVAGEAFATVFRGLPELLTLFLVYFGAPRLVTAVQGAMGLEAAGAIEIDAFTAGVLALALVFGAFSSETLLGAMRSVPTGQREAAAALGLSRAQGLRLVEAPQVARLALPGLGASWTTLLKDTALVSVIALPDLMREAHLAALATHKPFLFYGAACLIYLAVSGVSDRALAGLERRLALPQGEGAR